MSEPHGRTQQKHPDFVDDQRGFFDELITTEWESYRDPAWDAARRIEVEGLFRLVTARRILDVGCGCGFHDVLLAGQPGVEEVVGIDYSERSIEVADREYPHARVRRFVADVFTLPPGAYDLVVSFQVIEHLRDAERFLAACAAQARPGGAVAVATPNRLRLTNRLRILLGRPAALADPQHFREYDLAALEAMGRAAGLAPAGRFAAGASLELPGLGGQVVPPALGRWLGPRWPAIADVVAVVWRKPS